MYVSGWIIERKFCICSGRVGKLHLEGVRNNTYKLREFGVGVCILALDISPVQLRTARPTNAAILVYIMGYLE